MDDNQRQVATTAITAVATLAGVAIGAGATWWLERGRRRREDRYRFIDARRLAYDGFVKTYLHAVQMARYAAHFPDGPVREDPIEMSKASEAAFSGVQLHGSDEAITAAVLMYGAAIAMQDASEEVGLRGAPVELMDSHDETTQSAMRAFMHVARRDLDIPPLSGSPYGVGGG